MSEINEHYSRKNKIRHLIILAILTVFCIIAYNFFIKSGGYDINGVYIYYTPKGAFTNSLIGFFISLPILAFIIGLLVSLFPYRNLPYAKKYLRSSILSLIVIDSLLAIGLIIIIGMTIVGTYPPKISEQTIIQGKQQKINEYKAIMKPMIDSSIIYLEIMIRKFENTNDIANISNDRKSFNNLQNQMTKKAEVFRCFASDYKLSKEEYMQVLSFWGNQSIEMINKENKLDSIIKVKKNVP